jgi:hypothetical protein
MELIFNGASIFVLTVLEVASGEHGSHVLADAVELQESRRVSEAEVASPSTAFVHEKRPSVCFEDTTVKFDGIQIITDLPKGSGEERGGRSSSLLTQFLLLYVRNVHILTRNYVSINKTVYHVFSHSFGCFSAAA